MYDPHYGAGRIKNWRNISKYSDCLIAKQRYRHSYYNLCPLQLVAAILLVLCYKNQELEEEKKKKENTENIMFTCFNAIQLSFYCFSECKCIRLFASVCWAGIHPIASCRGGIANGSMDECVFMALYVYYHFSINPTGRNLDFLHFHLIF